MNTASKFMEQTQSALQQLRLTAPAARRAIRVAGCTFELKFWGEALFAALWPALAHLEINLQNADPEIRLDLWDSASRGVYPPRLPFALEDYQRNNRWAMADDGRTAILHLPGSHTLFAYDRQACQGFFWTPDAAALSIYERAAPLQTLFHWALSERGWHILHAAAIGAGGTGALLVGGTGAGKSTTALACLQDPRLRYLSDDKCLGSLSPGPQAFGFSSAAKLKADMLEALPHFHPLVAGRDEVFKAGKSLVYLYPEYQERMVASFPVRTILIANITHKTHAALRPASSQDVLRVLGPSTLFWLPGSEASSMRFMAALVRQLPAYWLDLALDPRHNMDAIFAAIEAYA